MVPRNGAVVGIIGRLPAVRLVRLSGDSPPHPPDFCINRSPQVCGHVLVVVCCVVLLRLFSKCSEADRSGIWHHYAPMIVCFLTSSALAIPSWILLILAYRNFYSVPLDNLPLSQSPHFKAAFPFYCAYLAVYPFHFACQCTGKLFVLLRFCEQALRPQSAAATRALIQLGSRYGWFLIVVLNMCSVVSACVTAGRSVQIYRAMPLPPTSSSADSQEFASIGNALLQSLGFHFVFETAILLLVVLLFLVGGVVTLRFLRQVSDSLDHIALHVQGKGAASKSSAAKAKVLREGVDSMGRSLERTAVVVFVTFVVHAAYNTMCAVALPTVFFVTSWQVRGRFLCRGLQSPLHQSLRCLLSCPRC